VLFFHSKIGQDLSHIGRIDPFLQLAVSDRKSLLADPVEGTWVSPGGLGNQESSPWSEDSGCRASHHVQPMFDITQGFLRGEWSESAPHFNSLVEGR